MRDMEYISRLKFLDFIRIFGSTTGKHGLLAAIVTTTHLWLLSYGLVKPKLTPDGRHVKIATIKRPIF